MLLFWGCFLPLGDRMSVDAVRQPARTNAWLSVGTVALLVQVIIVYASAGISKWLQPAWHDGSALLSILDDDFRVTASGLLLARAPDLARSFARAVPVLEIGGAALLLVPSALVRTATVVVLCAMNVLFGLCLDIGLFPWVASVALLGLLPSWVWERPVVDAWVVQPIDRAAAWLARRLPAHVPRPWRRVGALEALCAVFLAYVVVWCVGVAGDSAYRARPEIEWLGSTFFLQQDWRMFSVPPTRSGWIVIPGRSDRWSRGRPAARRRPRAARGRRERGAGHLGEAGCSVARVPERPLAPLSRPRRLRPGHGGVAPALRPLPLSRVECGPGRRATARKLPDRFHGRAGTWSGKRARLPARDRVDPSLPGIRRAKKFVLTL